MCNDQWEYIERFTFKGLEHQYKLCFTDDQKSQIQKEIQNEKNKVEKIFNKELEKWKEGSFRIKLLILAEAPLSSDKYFYHKPGNFLYGIKNQLISKLTIMKNSIRP